MRALLLLTTWIAMTTAADGAAADANAASGDAPAASPTVLADRAYGDGIAAFDRAQAADALGRRDDAKRELVAARAALDDAIARYRELIAHAPTVLPDAERRLGDALTTGKACCGKASLWKRYGVESAGDAARPR